MSSPFVINISCNKQFIAVCAFALLGLPVTENDNPVELSSLLIDVGYVDFLLDAAKDAMVENAIKEAFESAPDNFPLAVRMAASEILHIYGGIVGIVRGNGKSKDHKLEAAVEKFIGLRNRRAADGTPTSGPVESLMDILKSLGMDTDNLEVMQLGDGGAEQVNLEDILPPSDKPKGLN